MLAYLPRETLKTITQLTVRMLVSVEQCQLGFKQIFKFRRQSQSHVATGVLAAKSQELLSRFNRIMCKIIITKECRKSLFIDINRQIVCYYQLEKWRLGTATK